MASYGRKLIQHLFKKRPNSPSICYRLERRAQADCDRSDIRVFEAGLPTQRHGDFGQSKRATESQISDLLIDIAKRNNLYIPKADWHKFGDKRTTSSGESIVYLSLDGLTFTKLKSPFTKSAIKNTSPYDVIFEHLIHNILFPTTRYRFIGITDDNGELRLVLQQDNIQRIFCIPSQKVINNFLTGELHLSREDAYFYGNDFYAITDVSAESDNVLCDENGQLFFIDPIIKLKKSAVEVLNYLYDTRCTD